MPNLSKGSRVKTKGKNPRYGTIVEAVAHLLWKVQFDGEGEPEERRSRQLCVIPETAQETTVAPTTTSPPSAVLPGAEAPLLSDDYNSSSAPSQSADSKSDSGGDLLLGDDSSDEESALDDVPDLVDDHLSDEQEDGDPDSEEVDDIVEETGENPIAVSADFEKTEEHKRKTELYLETRRPEQSIDLLQSACTLKKVMQLMSTISFVKET